MTTEERDFLESLAIGSACKALPVRKKLPIAYSYNGTILPKLPEWDREMYPYAIITKPLLGNSSLHLLSEWEYYIGSTSQQEGIVCPVGTQNYRVTLPGTEWEREADSTEKSQKVQPWILWTNTDYVCQTDIFGTPGSVYLAASDPIPVYE